MGLLDKAKMAAEQVASRAREGVDDVQAKRALSTAYGELGELAFELIEKGEISHERMNELAAEIRTQRAVLEDDAAAAPAAPAADAPPPAMPT